MTAVVVDVLKRREVASGGGLLFQNREGSLIAEDHTRDRLKRLFPAAGIERGGGSTGIPGGKSEEAAFLSRKSLIIND